MLRVLSSRVNYAEESAERPYTHRARKHHNFQQTASPSLTTKALFSDGRRRSFSDIALAVIIGRITVDCVNVIGRLIALRRVLDHEVWPLDAVVSHDICTRL
jgi:hypothetical protein